MKKVLLGILIGIVLGGGAYYGYERFIKDVEVTENKTEVKIEKQTVYNDYITSQFYGIAIDESNTVVKKADIPQIVGEHENIKSLNEKMYSVHESIISMIKNKKFDGQLADFNETINYDFAIKDDILFIRLNYNSNDGEKNNYTYQGFYYDLESNEELTSEDIATKYDITVEQINQALEENESEFIVSDFSNSILPINDNLEISLNSDGVKVQVTLQLK